MIDEFPYLIPGKLYRILKSFSLVNNDNLLSVRLEKNFIVMYLKSIQINDSVRVCFLYKNKFGFAHATNYMNRIIYEDTFEEINV